MNVGPENAREDEKAIAKSYRNGEYLLALALLMSGFWIVKNDLSWAAGTIAVLALVLLSEIASRIYDLCIRARRTNLLLIQISEQIQVRNKYDL